ncbi:MAG: VanZ family protein [Gemmatimonadaceae bacterium]
MKVRRWLPPLLWAGLIFFATSMPGSLLPQQVSTVDKLAHFTMYMVLAFLLARYRSEVTSRWRSAGFALAVAIAYGAIDEWHQQFIPGRSTELADWYADSLGAASGALLFLLYSWRSRTLTA